MTLTHAEIRTILLLHLLEQLVIAEGQVTVGVNDTPSIKCLRETLVTNGIHTCKQVDQMGTVVEILLVRTRSTEREGLVVVLSKEQHTTLSRTVSGRPFFTSGSV